MENGMKKFKMWYYDKQGKTVEVIVWADNFDTAFDVFHKSHGDDLEVDFIREIPSYEE